MSDARTGSKAHLIQVCLIFNQVQNTEEATFIQFFRIIEIWRTILTENKNAQASM